MKLPRKAPRLSFFGYDRDYSVVSVAIRSQTRRRFAVGFQGKPLIR